MYAEGVRVGEAHPSPPPQKKKKLEKNREKKKAKFTKSRKLTTFTTIEEYSAKRGSSPQIMKIELVSISATESFFLHSVKVS